MTVSHLFTQVLNMSVTASLVILPVLVLRLLLRKAPKVYSYLLWAVVLFRLLCPVSLSTSWSVFRFAEPNTTQEQGLTTKVVYIDSSREVQLPAAAPDLPTRDFEPVTSCSFKSAVPWIWLIIAIGMFLYGIITDIRFRRSLAAAFLWKPGVYLVDHLRTACVCGLFQPRIYLPSDLSEREMVYILAHEKHHLKRYDHVVKHLSFFALCLHWFNPLVWVAFFLSAKDMEMSCDEAVIQAMGEHIRADYAASLLQLSVEKRTLAGSPLSFGESDTKGRIRNMARWHKPKTWVRLLSVSLCAVIMVACASNPKAVSDNKTVQPAIPVTAPTDPEAAIPPPPEFLEFSSDDGTVAYRMMDGVNLATDSAAAVTVSPRTLTSADLQRVARVLVGEADFYEREPTVGAQYSKAQYQQMLDRLSPYANLEAMEDLVGISYALDQVVQVKHTIDLIQTSMETAPEENPLTPCDWKLKKERVYNNGEWEFQGRPLSQDANWLVATSEISGMGCSYMAVVADAGEYKLSRYLFQLGGASVDSHLDRQICWKELCRTGEPSEKQIQAAQEKVLNLLHKMEHGPWQIAKVEVQRDRTGSQPEYRLSIHAVPVLNGTPAFHSLDVPLPMDETGSYVLTEATFLMSANGDLLDMELDTPLEIQSVREKHALPFSKLLEIAQAQLSSLDAGKWGMQQEDLTAYQENLEPEIACEVTVSQFAFGMYRTMESGNTYTYAPMLLLQGNVQYRGESTGRIYYSNEEQGPVFLLGINALDGTVIGP